jgi:hypothetical protein
MDLPSFPFVRDTYLDAPAAALPNQPWLAERERTVAPRIARAAGG